MTQYTNTHELIEALEKADERASVKIMVKDYADGWYELKVSRRLNVEQLRQALANQPQAEAQPGVGELVAEIDALFEKATSTPWVSEGPEYPGQEIYIRGQGRFVCEVDCGNAYEVADDNAALILKLVNAWPRLKSALTPAQPAGDVRESDKVEYLIWSGEHNAYWRPDAAGYSTRIRDAGRYSLEDAKKRTAHCGPEKRIEIEPIAALSATPAVSGWRPMSEAPKDGTPILGYKPFDGNWKENQDHLVEVRWRTDSFGWTGFMGLEGQRWNVTKWMPRPLPPQNEGGDGDE